MPSRTKILALRNRRRRRHWRLRRRGGRRDELPPSPPSTTAIAAHGMASYRGRQRKSCRNELTPIGLRRRPPGCCWGQSWRQGWRLRRRRGGGVGGGGGNGDDGCAEIGVGTSAPIAVAIARRTVNTSVLMPAISVLKPVISFLSPATSLFMSAISFLILPLLPSSSPPYLSPSLPRSSLALATPSPQYAQVRCPGRFGRIELADGARWLPQLSGGMGRFLSYQ